jgi:hypothetical protein
MAKISKQLADDLRWLVQNDKWDEEDKAEAKRCLEADPIFFSHFFTALTAARRKGYDFVQNGSYVKLAQFCAENGLPDPYMGLHSDKEVDA